MNRTKGILAAGTLTGLVLVTLLALGFGNLKGSTDQEKTAVSDPTPVIIQQPIDNSGDEAALQAWQDYTTDLENTVSTMQAREREYQTQLDSANQTIIQLQDQVNSANAAASRAPAYFEDDDDEYEGQEEGEDHEENEHEEQEREEHEDDDD